MECATITYEPQKKPLSRHTIVWKLIASLLSFLFSLAILGLIIFSKINGTWAWIVAIILFCASILGFLDIFSATKRVQKIKCYKDKFVLYSCFDEMTLSYDKSELSAIKHTHPYFHNFGMIGFCKEGKEFFVDGNDFPEFVKEIKSVFENLDEPQKL